MMNVRLNTHLREATHSFGQPVFNPGGYEKAFVLRLYEVKPRNEQICAGLKVRARSWRVSEFERVDGDKVPSVAYHQDKSLPFWEHGRLLM